MGDEDRDVKILEELSNGTPWNTIAEKYQISTRTISEKLSHRHCPVCATPVFMFEQFCGPECEKVFKRAQRKGQYMLLLPILLIFPFFLMLILLMAHR
jgi:predicted nucleic acid-binding Zn ribbon protein